MPSIVSRQSGFSLVEISIVLVIIGLLMAGVMGGIALKNNTALNNIMKDITALTQATQQFTETYGGLPGDLWNATNKFGTANNKNGNGDGLINTWDTTQEEALAFQHLVLAGLIKGNYTTDWSAASVMPGPITGSAYYFATLNNAPAITFAGIGTSQTNQLAILTPGDMYKIDQKYDDGLPNSGKIRASTGASASGTCANSGAATDTYNFTNSNAACIFTVIIGKAYQ